MANKNKRYPQQTPFTNEAGSEPVFKGYRPRKITRATGVIEYTLNENERHDLLAQHFYADSRLWWRILDANPEILCAADLSLPARTGDTIVIPQAAEKGNNP